MKIRKQKFSNNMKYLKNFLIITGVGFVNFIILNNWMPWRKNAPYFPNSVNETHLWGKLTCYGDTEDISELKIDMEKRNIFFHETSCHGDINSRQACSIESAARAHPKWNINVILTRPISDIIREKLKTFDNVKLSRIIVSKYAKGSRSPLDVAWKGSKGLRDSLWPKIHASDILRLITLQKYGGVYLDLDVIVVKSFEDLPRNWVAREDDYDVVNTILAVATDDVGKRFSASAFSDMLGLYDPRSWGSLGPILVTHILQQTCSTTVVSKMSATTCKGFEVFPPQYFYPIHFSDWQKYFRSTDLVLGEEYTHHLWNNASRTRRVPQDSLYAKLAQRFCPTIFEMYGDEFGN